jgi:hypothetical protein
MISTRHIHLKNLMARSFSIAANSTFIAVIPV